MARNDIITGQSRLDNVSFWIKDDAKGLITDCKKILNDRNLTSKDRVEKSYKKFYKELEFALPNDSWEWSVLKYNFEYYGKNTFMKRLYNNIFFYRANIPEEKFDDIPDTHITENSQSNAKDRWREFYEGE